MCMLAAETQALEELKQNEKDEICLTTLENSSNSSQEIDKKSHEIVIEIKIECPMSAELADFVDSIPTAGTYSSSFQEWKSSFVNNMMQLIHLVESEKILNSYWSVKTDEDLAQKIVEE